MSDNLKLKPAEQTTFESFGNYILLKKLAEGGMAEVFLARPNSYMGNGRLLVIKRLLPHFSNQPMFLSMFQNEIQVLMGFCHPNTVQLHDFGNVGDQPFIAMEFLNGKNLRDVSNKVIQKKSKQIPIPVVLSLIIQAAAGLDYAHTFSNAVTGEQANTIHRDVSPQNLIVSYDGNLKVIDFGIAKANTNLDEKTRIGTIKGKAAYLSPEQNRGEVVDCRSDVYSLGIVAWELLTLIRYYEQKAATNKVNENANGIRENSVAPSAYNDEIPLDLDMAILKALRINPSDRYQSANEFQVALRQVMQRYYAGHTYAETGKYIRSLFETEIAAEKTEIFNLNKEIQQALFNQDATVVISPAPQQLTPTADLMEDKENLQTRIAIVESLIKRLDHETTRVSRVEPRMDADDFTDRSSDTNLAQEHFDSLLARDLNIDPSKILKIRDTQKVRTLVNGRINIYDTTGKIITKAKLRNCCLGGIGFETTPSMLGNYKEVLVEFNSDGFGPKMGMIKAEVKWIAPIEGHYWGHHLGGLQFAKLTPESTRKLGEYLKNYKRTDGFGIDDR
tara:strand:+ start:5136 stop:6815 length:1680 start_codon:yes stop_codon:yes gene_type:complete